MSKPCKVHTKRNRSINRDPNWTQKLMTPSLYTVGEIYERTVVVMGAWLLCWLSNGVQPLSSGPPQVQHLESIFHDPQLLT